MKIFRRLLRITRILLLAILAVYAAAALVLNVSDPEFKSATGVAATAAMAGIFEGELHRSICDMPKAMPAAGNWLVRNDLTEASLDAR